MIVAVSMRVTEASGYYEPRDAISHDWIPFLEQRGLTPLLIPNRLADPAAYLRQFNVDALLLTGGNDLVAAPLPPDTEAPDFEVPESACRDQTELNLLQTAIRDRLPVLGVCRGMQLINSYFGGQVRRDLSSFGEHVAVNHPVSIRAGVLDCLNGIEKAETNSFHNQGMLVSDIARELSVFAWAANEVVEGIKHESLPILAVQWHPERPNPAHHIDDALIEHWLTTCV